MNDQPISGKFIVYSDVPPMGNEGISMSVLSHRITASLGNDAVRLITRVHSNKYPRNQIGQNLDIPVQRSWDCAGLGLRFIKGNLRTKADKLFLDLWSRFNPMTFGDNVKEIIGLSGPHGSFLPRLHRLAKNYQLPYSVYVIDDYEITESHSARPSDPEKFQNYVKFYLKQARRVFAISPGMRQRLLDRYGVDSTILYPIADDPLLPDETPAFEPRRLIYVGSLGPAYLDTLLEFARANESNSEKPWQLHIISTDRKGFARHFSSFKHVTADHDCDREALRKQVAASEAIFIPYSFSPIWRVTSETSFPSKFMDAVAANKPIVVTGPPNSSIVRHMRDHHCGFVANSVPEVLEFLKNRPWLESQAWSDAYQELALTHHSVKAAHRILTDFTLPGQPPPEIRSSKPIVETS